MGPRKVMGPICRVSQRPSVTIVNLTRTSLRREWARSRSTSVTPEHFHPSQPMPLTQPPPPSAPLANPHQALATPHSQIVRGWDPSPSHYPSQTNYRPRKQPSSGEGESSLSGSQYSSPDVISPTFDLSGRGFVQDNQGAVPWPVKMEPIAPNETHGYPLYAQPATNNQPHPSMGQYILQPNGSQIFIPYNGS